MKETGIDWIGQIPKDWEIKRFKYLHNGTNVGEAIDKEYWSQDKKDCVFYTAGESNIYTTYEKFPFWKYVRSEDLLLARNGTPYVYLAPINSQYSDHIIRAKIIKNYDKRFIRSCLQLSIKTEKVEVVSLATWSVSVWNEQKIPIPSTIEQKKIADFLDKQTSKIDAIIKTNEEQLEILKKYKKSLITQTVTKGLDKNVKMKDSGIDWIGKIPEEWIITRLKYELNNSMQYGASEAGIDYLETLPRYIRITDITKDNKLRDDEKLSLPENLAKPYLLKDGDLLFARSGATVGKTFLYFETMGRAAFAGYLIKASPNKSKLLPKFLNYLTLTNWYDDWKEISYSQATIQNIGADKYSNMYIILPPIFEQKEIIFYLDAQCEKIDSLIIKKQQAIDTMQKYKKSLIYEYVTGKKRIK